MLTIFGLMDIPYVYQIIDDIYYDVSLDKRLHAAANKKCLSAGMCEGSFER